MFAAFLHSSSYLAHSLTHLCASIAHSPVRLQRTATIAEDVKQRLGMQQNQRAQQALCLCRIGNEGAYALVRALTSNRILTSLHVGRNR
eukprot:3578706-Pleurochrysis_carterae.AAC.1